MWISAASDVKQWWANNDFLQGRPPWQLNFQISPSIIFSLSAGRKGGWGWGGVDGILGVLHSTSNSGENVIQLWVAFLVAVVYLLRICVFVYSHIRVFVYFVYLCICTTLQQQWWKDDSARGNVDTIGQEWHSNCPLPFDTSLKSPKYWRWRWWWQRWQW